MNTLSLSSAELKLPACTMVGTAGHWAPIRMVADTIPMSSVTVRDRTQ